VAPLAPHGKFRFTETNAYSVNNGRAAILNDSNGTNVLYTAGNAGNGGNPQPDGVIIGAGAQILTPEVKAMVAQRPGDPTRSAASTSPCSATNRTRSVRTPTSAGSGSSIMSSITRRAAAATASTRSTSSIPQGSMPRKIRWRARREAVSQRHLPACRPRRWHMILLCCRQRGLSPTTCAY
jgi:hypothetical protein